MIKFSGIHKGINYYNPTEKSSSVYTTLQFVCTHEVQSLEKYKKEIHQ